MHDHLLEVGSKLHDHLPKEVGLGVSRTIAGGGVMTSPGVSAEAASGAAAGGRSDSSSHVMHLPLETT